MFCGMPITKMRYVCDWWSVVGSLIMRYHFIGVAGVGMSAVAQAALGEGCVVSGSDRQGGEDCGTVDCGQRGEGRGQTASPKATPSQGRFGSVLFKLERAGVSLFPQDGSGVTANLDGVVVSTAIEDDNPDLVAAGALNVPVLHRSEMLAQLVAGKRCFAVTGTSGKSTVTGMIGWVLSELGADPTVVNGAPVLNWMDDGHVGNVRQGGSDLWVIEADESDRSLMTYHPDWAVVTNVSADHFTFDESVRLFADFEAQVKEWTIKGPVEPADTEMQLVMRGAHNAENAVMAMRACEKLGYDAGPIAAALESFKGIHRRFELTGTSNGVAVIDDYAHNPAKIVASWRTAREDSSRVIGIWRPHGYGPLKKMMEDLVSSLQECVSGGDKLFVMPIYDAGGTADRSVNSDELVRRLKDCGVDAEYVLEDDVVGRVAGQAEAGDVILLMGARDPGLPGMARAILGKL